MVKLGHQLIVHGGTSFDSLTAKSAYFWDLWVFNTKNCSWSSVSIERDAAKLGRAFHAGCIYRDDLIIYGGKFQKRYDKHRLVK